MPGSRAVSAPDRGQRRASLAQARSKETKRALVQAAMALWRTGGYATTTVADICRAAGVSKALFYFYFPRKEDVLFEVGVMSTRSARRVVADMLVGDYDMPAVIAAALSDLERSMARNPRELIIETILEGYRHEHRIMADTAGGLGNDTPDLDSGMFTALFDRAVADGKLPAHTDVTHLAYLAMTLVSEGARHWAAGAFGNRSFADVVGADIVTLIAGYQRS
ncbi:MULTISPECIES: TetR/AcrR family transcriptional regulator [Mycobacteriaceae]|jgi:AcrR family transcriptional regulator|uniref:Transcriptional regulator, TetR family n=1 Tax=Mycolicibacterium fluoranthenivorans TaxID=258505 RepID=A0A1G4V3P5_9MYCO|nr:MULTISPECIES: TetR/AcrR family transcriptional regulator [Mycobacteriaceae]MCV7255109.1 TetR/AcrR family transcriptional regulator [Mycobacterium hackensackense]SCX00724.1 transcriptional regulator, TetR family [Mycolicibacterium fluoranthenivorans]